MINQSECLLNKANTAKSEATAMTTLITRIIKPNKESAGKLAWNESKIAFATLSSIQRINIPTPIAISQLIHPITDNYHNKVSLSITTNKKEIGVKDKFYGFFITSAKFFYQINVCF
jgi:hypothetical protein